MASSQKTVAALFLVGLFVTAAPAAADGRRAGGGHGAPGVSGRVVPRGAGPAFRPYAYTPRPYRPYAYRPSYGYRPYYGYYGYRPYVYGPAVGLGFYFGRPYASYGYPGYAYGPSAYGYYSVVPGRTYGAVRIADAPQDAEVYVDGYYAGLVGDYNGTVNLEAGPHHVEVALPGNTPVAFDVRVDPGRTITYRAYNGRP